MKKSLFLISLLISSAAAIAQQRGPGGAPGGPVPAPTQAAPAAANAPKGEVSKSRTLDPDMNVVTESSVTIKGQRVPYKAVAGTQPVWDENGKIIASCFYTYYERTDVKDKSKRPLVFSFNGGPGSASVWMHIAYTGPKILNIDDEGYPVQPYGYKDNPYSILDVADIIYIDPVNTGFSRIIDASAPKSTFFGVNADIKYLAEWLNTWVSRVNRWASPKYLIGESYGTTRVSGLAYELQNNHWMYLNGVILVSPTELGINRDQVNAAGLRLPYFAATAWYHKALDNSLQSKDLTAMLPEVEKFTVEEYLPALVQGGSMSPEKRKAIAAKVAKYAGLKEEVVLQNNLQISTNLFWKELLRDKGYTVGRLDSRYLGIDQKDAGERPDFNSELTSWLHSFTPPINMYLRDELKFKTDLKYNMFGPVHPWTQDRTNVAENLRAAMAMNPYLHVFTQAGYYDGACDYFNSKYNMWQMDAAGKLQDRIHWKGYRSGHMMYLRKEDLIQANDDLRDFIKKTTPKEGTPAKY
ncbi:S10 family peptidase [Leadbetterella byssophila]|uniref:S10 family peptidase n=1 Tax=Leadbetterella byssophila TaxID=316068 RepID=UPI00399EE955